MRRYSCAGISRRLTPPTSGASLRLRREARAVSTEDVAGLYAGGVAVTRINQIEAMARVPARVETAYIAALVTVVLFRDRSCITVQSCPKLSQSGDFENLKIDQALGR
jgi:hypothetical protein